MRFRWWGWVHSAIVLLGILWMFLGQLAIVFGGDYWYALGIASVFNVAFIIWAVSRYGSRASAQDIADGIEADSRAHWTSKEIEEDILGPPEGPSQQGR